MVKLSPLVSNYLLDLDSLFDTRLGVLSLLGDDAVDSLTHDNYAKREDESFLMAIPGYKERWEARDIEVLQSSQVSKFFATAMQLILDDVHDVNVSLPDRKFFLYINTYPYKLNDIEKEDLVLMVSAQLHGRVKVTTRSFSLGALSPRTIASNCYGLVSIYEFEKWVKLHIDALYKLSLSEVVVVAPELKEIGAKVIEKPTELMLQLLERYSKWECLELALMEVLALKYYPVAEYCSLLYLAHITEQKEEG